jgi:hypothetical protein
MYYSLSSQYGHLTVVYGYNPNWAPTGMHFDIGDKALEPFVGSPSEPTLTSFLWLRWYSSNGVQAFREFILAAPHWLLLLYTVTLGTIPWLHWRFSLRTLLIAMTLVAVVLGLIVAFSR